MQSIHAQYSASISELKQNPTAILEQSEGNAVAILNHNKPTAYFVPAKTYESLLEKLEDFELGCIVRERQHEKKAAISVILNDL